jgi:hypothetical protein
MQIANCKFSIANSAICILQCLICNLQFFHALGDPVFKVFGKSLIAAEIDRVELGLGGEPAAPLGLVVLEVSAGGEFQEGGADGRVAGGKTATFLYSIMATAKANQVGPFATVRDKLSRLSGCSPPADVTLLPTPG